MNKPRYATTHDVPALLELAKREHALSPWAHMPFDAEACRLQMLGFVSGLGRTAFITDGGYLFGMVQAAGFSNARIAIEYAWFAEDHSGMALLTEFEKWAVSMGAYAVVAHDYTGKETLAPILERRRGYSRIGLALTKKL